MLVAINRTGKLRGETCLLNRITLMKKRFHNFKIAVLLKHNLNCNQVILASLSIICFFLNEITFLVQSQEDAFQD